MNKTCRCGHEKNEHSTGGTCLYSEDDEGFCDCDCYRPLYPFLSDTFLEAMNDIGRCGHEKYGEHSFHHRATTGNHSRGELDRHTSQEIAKHSAEHFAMYLRGEKHDKFDTLQHQLAAVAFNAMMEAHFMDGDK